MRSDFNATMTGIYKPARQAFGKNVAAAESALFKPAAD
jgi:hypothetical protein